MRAKKRKLAVIMKATEIFNAAKVSDKKTVCYNDAYMVGVELPPPAKNVKFPENRRACKQYVSELTKFYADENVCFGTFGNNYGSCVDALYKLAAKHPFIKFMSKLLADSICKDNLVKNMPNTEYSKATVNFVYEKALTRYEKAFKYEFLLYADLVESINTFYTLKIDIDFGGYGDGYVFTELRQKTLELVKQKLRFN
jgi:hypothetical protein